MMQTQVLEKQQRSLADHPALPDLESVLRTVLTGQAVAATSLLGMLGGRLGTSPRNNANRITQLLGDLGCGFAGLELDIDGPEHLRQSGPVIYVFNHQSLLDAMILARLLRRDVVPFCKQEMAGKPLLGSLLARAGTIFVDRAAQDQSAVLQAGLAVLADGRSLVIAPEGTRSASGTLQPFRHGAFFLAKKARVPIVPIVLHNVHDALPKGGLLLRPATVRVSVLPPVAHDAERNVRGLCEQVENRYRRRLGQPPGARLCSAG
jgi:putative phosphoserine phosphatase/1-acylglycerol-3-phosphate O-acyltransferase